MASSLPASTRLLTKGRGVMVPLLLCGNQFALISLIQEDQPQFDDLGKLVLVVVVVAIALALGFTFVRLRLRAKRPQTSSFISISTPPDKEA